MVDFNIKKISSNHKAVNLIKISVLLTLSFLLISFISQLFVIRSIRSFIVFVTQFIPKVIGSLLWLIVSSYILGFIYINGLPSVANGLVIIQAIRVSISALLTIGLALVFNFSREGFCGACSVLV